MKELIFVCFTLSIGVIYSQVYPSNQSGKYKYYNESGELAFDKEWKYATAFIDSYAYVESKKMGVIDTNGNYVIKPRYNYVFNFESDIIYVSNFFFSGYLDKNGHKLFREKNGASFHYLGNSIYLGLKKNKYYFYTLNSKLRELKTDFLRVGGCSVNFCVADNGFDGTIIDHYGTSLLDTLIPNIKKLNGSDTYFQFGKALDDKKNTLSYGLINYKGYVLFEPLFQEITTYKDSLFGVRSDTKWGIINLKLDTIIDFKYDDLKIVSHNRAIVKQNDNYNILDIENGNLLTGLNFDKIFFSHNNFVVISKDAFGLVSNIGEVLLPTQFDYIEIYDKNICGIFEINGDFKFPFYNIDWAKQSSRLYNYKKGEFIVLKEK